MYRAAQSLEPRSSPARGEVNLWAVSVSGVQTLGRQAVMKSTRAAADLEVCGAAAAAASDNAYEPGQLGPCMPVYPPRAAELAEEPGYVPVRN